MDIKLLCEKYFDAWARRDVDAIIALRTPDTVFHSHVNQEAVTGANNVRDSFAALLRAMPDIAFKAWDLRFGDDFWVAQMVVSARLGTGGEMIEYSSNSFDVIVVRNGLVHRNDSYLDQMKWAANQRTVAAA